MSIYAESVLFSFSNILKVFDNSLIDLFQKQIIIFKIIIFNEYNLRINKFHHFFNIFTFSLVNNYNINRISWQYTSYKIYY